MILPQFELPTQPPDLNMELAVSDEQRDEAAAAIEQLSAWLDDLPVVLARQDRVMCATVDDASAERIADLANQMWQADQNRLSREVLRFERFSLEESAQRKMVILYSLHITGPITLSVAWRTTLSLTQLRAEAVDVKETLLSILT